MLQERVLAWLRRRIWTKEHAGRAPAGELPNIRRRRDQEAERVVIRRGEQGDLKKKAAEYSALQEKMR